MMSRGWGLWKGRDYSPGRTKSYTLGPGAVGDARVVPELARCLHAEQLQQAAEAAMWAVFMRSGSSKIDAMMEEGATLMQVSDGLGMQQSLGCMGCRAPHILKQPNAWGYRTLSLQTIPSKTLSLVLADHVCKRCRLATLKCSVCAQGLRNGEVRKDRSAASTCTLLRGHQFGAVICRGVHWGSCSLASQQDGVQA